MELMKAFNIAASGLRVQSERVRVIAENVANSGSTGKEPGDLPYRRKTISFSSQLDKAVGANLVHIDNIGVDRSPFGQRYDPNHPAADANGYIQTSNVNSLIEMMDMREAQRSYEANLSVIKMTRELAARTIELLRG